MITFALLSVATTVGFLLGSFLTNFKINRQDWVVLRWHAESLGYRSVAPGMKIHKGDRVMMSLDISTSDIPEEGMVVE